MGVNLFHLAVGRIMLGRLQKEIGSQHRESGERLECGDDGSLTVLWT